MGGIAASAVVVGVCVVEVVQMKEETARRKEANETARRRHREEQETARRNAREAEETARRREAEETARRRHQEEQETIRLSEITFRRILPDGNIYEMTLRGLRAFEVGQQLQNALEQEGRQLTEGVRIST